MILRPRKQTAGPDDSLFVPYFPPPVLSTKTLTEPMPFHFATETRSEVPRKSHSPDNNKERIAIAKITAGERKHAIKATTVPVGPTLRTSARQQRIHDQHDNDKEKEIRNCHGSNHTEVQGIPHIVSKRSKKRQATKCIPMHFATEARAALHDCHAHLCAVLQGGHRPL
eukprot:Ihof_evm5s59 gene=Ihof_evmTU5s59